MNPIYEYRPNQGIGYGFNDFLNHFIDICYEHLRNKRAKAFAFILFDFEHGNVFDIMRNRSVFTKLDRISGHDITIFYVNSNEENFINQFNEIFTYALFGTEEISLPAIVFFKVLGNEVEGVESHLISNDRLFAFQEITEKVKDYIKQLNKKTEIRHDFMKKIFQKITEIEINYVIDKSFEMFIKK